MIRIGILKEQAGERRVALLPEHLQALKTLNAEVFVEKGAGGFAFASDDAYTKDGAAVTSREQVLKEADLVISIHPPKPEDLEFLKPDAAVLALFQPLADRAGMEELLQGQITIFSLDNIPRSTRAQTMDVLSSMATVAGYKAVLMAAANSVKFFPMLTTAAGSVAPAKVLILGAGVAGLMAIATARRLGAVVEAFDVRRAAKEDVLSLGAKFIEVEGALDVDAAGGYAVEQSEEYRQKQMAAVHAHAIRADAIISTAMIPGKRAPILIKTETVQAMKPGSVIVDLASATGGNCELTVNNEVREENGVTIMGISDIASYMPVDASKMFGKNVVNLLKVLLKDGQLNFDFNDEIIRETCIIHKGEIISTRVRNSYYPQNINA